MVGPPCGEVGQPSRVVPGFAMFSHPHGLQWHAPNQYTLFDNNLYVKMRNARAGLASNAKCPLSVCLVEHGVHMEVGWSGV